MAAGNIFRFDPQPPQRPPRVPPSALVTGDQPPFIGRRLATMMAVATMAWPATGEPRLPNELANQRKVAAIIPPPAPAADNPPARHGMHLVLQRVVHETWRVDWPAQSDPHNAAWNQPAAPAGDTLLRSPAHDLLDTVIRAWPVGWEAQHGAAIAPLTLAYGQQPPVRDARRGPNLQAAWHEDVVTVIYVSDGAPLAEEEEAADEPPLRNPTRAQLPRVLEQWRVEWPAQRTKPVAPLTLVYGDAPPLRGVPEPAATWFDLVYPVQRRPLVVQAGEAPPLEFVPPSLHPSLDAWFQPPLPLPRRRLLTPPSVDRPPVVGAARARLTELLRAWVIEPPPRQRAIRATESGPLYVPIYVILRGVRDITPITTATDITPIASARDITPQTSADNLDDASE